MKKGYSTLLRERLVKKGKFDQTITAQRTLDVLSLMHDEKTFHEIRSFMNHRSSYTRKLAAAAYLAYAKAEKDVGPARTFVNQLIRQEAFHQVDEKVDENGLKKGDVQFLGQWMGSDGDTPSPSTMPLKDYLGTYSEEVLIKLGGVLRDADLGLGAKRRAIRIIELIPKQQAADLLLHTLAGAQDHAFRFVMIKALNQLCEQNPNVQMNRFLIKSEISREAKIYDKIHKICRFYDEEKVGRSSEDYLGVALKAISEESLERIFWYLHLLYPQEEILVIYERIIEYSEGDPVRIHAVELLSNTVDPDLLIILQKVLDGKKLVRVKERDIIEILKGFAKSQDRWFSVTSSFLVSDLALHERWPELAEFQMGSEFLRLLAKE